MFEIKFIFLRSKSYVAIFWICMGATLFGMRRIFNFLLIDATDRSKISSDQKRFFIALSLYTLSFFANTPFKVFVFLKGSTQIWEFGKILKLFVLNICRHYTMPNFQPEGRYIRTVCFLIFRIPCDCKLV